MDLLLMRQQSRPALKEKHTNQLSKMVLNISETTMTSNIIIKNNNTNL